MRNRRKSTLQPPGLFVHSNPPTVVAPHASVVRQWLRGGDMDKLEGVVLQGQGHKLLGEYASDLRVRAFLKTVPAFLARIDMVHEAAAKGNLPDLRTLLKPNSDLGFPRRRLAGLALSKDHCGTGLLHKAVYHEYREMAQWLASTFPGTLNVRDREGRTPLHYCGHCSDPEWMWTTLRQAGADPSLLDGRGRNPAYYMDHPEEAKLPTTPHHVTGGRFTSGENAKVFCYGILELIQIFDMIAKSETDYSAGLVVKPSNIRIWIHDRDLGRLRDVVWAGQGDKLLTQTSSHQSVRGFLAAVPYMMGVIKDMHAASVNNDLILLRRRAEPPVPREILLAQDVNGLTPLHKAAGLGHVEMVRALLAKCPEALSRTDREGRTALHYAAAAKGSGAVYDVLLEQGADENVLDKKGKLPSYYIQNAKELDQKLLTVVPEAPRTASVFPPSWDWNSLARDRAGLPPPPKLPPPPPALSNNGDSAFEDMIQDDTPEKLSPQTNPEIPVKTNKDDLKRPGTYDIDADEGVEDEEEEEEKEKGYTADSDEQEGHYEAEYAEVDPEYELKNEPAREEVEEPQEPGGETRTEETEQKRQGDDEEKEVADSRVASPDERIRRAVEEGSLEQLATLVLSGEGEALARQRSDNPDIQLFIDNIPTYMSKIEKVHRAAREGGLKELQAALDRRKFAVARESGSSLRLTPLHVAVLYGRTAVLRFLGGRFSETLHEPDTYGRTPLHYAATLRDNGHYYNLLAALGGDRTLKDKDGNTAEYYLEHPDHVTHEQLLAEFEGRPVTAVKSSLPRDEDRDRGVSEVTDNAVVSNGFPVFGPDDGQYLASSLGQPLIKGLTEVASKRPSNPVKYLANYLYTYEDDPNNQIDGQPKILEQTYTVEKSNELMAPPPPVPREDPKEGLEEEITDPESSPSAFKTVQRDEFGQMLLHFAMARSHGRNALFQLLQEVDCNLALRDELYRTPRDVAAQVGIQDNVDAVDKYVISLAATGQLEKLRELVVEGYDHVVDCRDGSATIGEVAAQRNQAAVLAFLETINSFEDKRERLHRAIRLASEGQVLEMLRLNPGLALAKNHYSRSSLHIAVLNQHENIVQHIAEKYPQALTIGDNLMRTALHYAMGVERVETLSRILIQAGATRVLKDLKGRQASYYFMNKSDIQKLQDEEDMLRV